MGSGGVLLLLLDASSAFLYCLMILDGQDVFWQVGTARVRTWQNS
jgi:hypothetical protein